ncbi:MAG TPA: GntR family transcriptional regulator [Usitatibacteraceae bacterium]|nr:GntR family transcriptional regulator [Usitatibacteraceae bacterium]
MDQPAPATPAAEIDLSHARLRAGAALDSPLYKEVKRLLTETIQSGEWKPGTAIPSERQLSARFHVAVGTLRKAVDELVQERILIRQQGRGTFVAAHNRDRMMFHFFHIQREDGEKPTPDVELLSFKASLADAGEAARLGIAAGDKVLRIANVLRLAGEPVIFDRISIPRALFPGLTAAQFRNRPSTIYHLYQTAFGITVVRSAERLRACRADAETARILGVAKGAPLLEIRRVAMTFHDAPVEYRVSLVNTEHHEYFSDLAKA